ncbi:Zn-dependent alcohol dehydrogenase [Devosia sp.]|uniref:Zn-dependent alcohol dehydrogenase n=1 Tax=Devosia sp. TaxID=1871048 RepID=UPI002FC79136
MQAAVLRAFGAPLEIETVSHANPGLREVLVEVAATGLCHTDLHFMQGHLPVPVPAILGHETAGVVLAVGAGVSAFAPGDHVVGCLSAFCGCCEFCLSGRPSICEDGDHLVRTEEEPSRLSLAGQAVTQFMNLSAFAERILVHENAIVKIDKAMPLDRAALIGCGVTTGFGAVVHTAKVQAGQSVAVVGCGAVGLSILQSARIAGAMDVIAIDINDARLETARRFGATASINPTGRDVVAEVRALTDNKGVHVAYEAVGTPKLVEQSFLMTRKGGTTVMVGLMGDGARIDLPFAHFIAERRVMGCEMSSNQFRTDVPRLVRLYLDGRLNLDDMITARIPLAGINEGFEAMKRGNGIRTVIDFHG